MKEEAPLKDIVFFRLTSSPLLAQEVADILSLPLGECEVRHFSDGEVMARPITNVRGKKVYVIQSTSTPVAERLMELLIFIDGLRNAKAKEVNLVIPYYGFCRQDRIARSGEPITAKLVADLLETVGVNRVITMDLHTPQTQGFFSCPVDDLSPISLFGEYYRRKLKELGASELPDSSLSIIDKRRPAPNEAEVINVVGEVEGKTCIIIDDIIDTAGTVLASAETLKSHGARGLLVGGTHGILSGGAEERLRTTSFIQDLCLTNSIERDIPWVGRISIAPMIAGVIRASESGLPVPDEWMAFY